MLLTNGEHASVSLKKFFDDFKLKDTKKFWIELSTSLEAAGNQDIGSTLRGPDLSELWERRNAVETCQDKKRPIINLHNSLMKYYCHCKPACNYMAANIRLNCNNTPPPDSNVSNFNMLFQDLHIPNSESNCYWRNIQISVCTRYEIILLRYAIMFYG